MTSMEQEEHYDQKSKTHYVHVKSNNSSITFLILTILSTIIATIINCISMMTDHWEYLVWNENKIHHIIDHLETGNNRNRIEVNSFFDEVVTKISIFDYKRRNETGAFLDYNYKNRTFLANIYLLPMHNGIWTSCISLSEERLSLFKDFPTKTCYNFLSTKLFKETPEHMTDWDHRMQNVSISCALVCLIILGSAALIGTFGILKHQLSAILVTGVMYLLAGVFALFTIIIFYCKRIDNRRNNVYHRNSVKIQIDNKSVIVDDGILQRMNYDLHDDFAKEWIPYYPAREFHVGWSFDLCIVGVLFVMIASIMWIIIANVFRHTPPLAVQL